MTHTVAIDFGTSRTKLAYWDPNTGKPELMRLGYHEERSIPSLFYLERGSERILWGYEAEELLADDPAGIIDVLKRRLRETYVWANRRRVTPSILLALLLTRLRERAGQEIAALERRLPEHAYLTLPALYGPTDERLLQEAAHEAGFTTVELVPEPVAAAQAWLAETGKRTTDVVVLDCGGGTIDWAYLQHTGDDFRLVPDCLPGGDKGVGGHDVDMELLALVRHALAADAEDVLTQQQPYYMREMRALKERYSRDLPLRAVKIGPQPIVLTEQDIQAVLETRFITQTCENLQRYLDRVRTVTAGRLPPVLLVGGGARLKGLAAAVETRCNCETVWWERSEYATVLGAVPVPTAGSRRRDPVPEPAWPATLHNSIGMEFVLIPAGTFRMGSNNYDSEKPVHEVRLTRAFYLGKYQVTQGQWQAVMGNNPSHFQGDANRPVENVSWEDVQEFIRRLNGREGGQKYRLPTEAEWEYAARAGTATAYSFGEDVRQLGHYAWYADNANKETHPVGRKQPNPWGLYDMHGNVWEWVQDWYAADYYQQFTRTVAVDPAGPTTGWHRVTRGGSWSFGAWYSKSAARLNIAPGGRNDYLGFRLAREG